MPILTYAVSLAYHFLDAPTEGVDDAAVMELQELGLRAWYSEVHEDTFSGAVHVTKAALAFHHFIAAVFREGTVLPFRFPTILESVDELRDYLEAKAAWYNDALKRSEGLAQFEARVVNKNKLEPAADTGKEYLEARQRAKQQGNAAVASVLAGLEDVLRDHHLKETPQGSRIYLLTERTRVASFREASSKISVPGGFEIRLTGPWPPTEFLPPAKEEP